MDKSFSWTPFLLATNIALLLSQLPSTPAVHHPVTGDLTLRGRKWHMTRTDEATQVVLKPILRVAAEITPRTMTW